MTAYTVAYVERDGNREPSVYLLTGTPTVEEIARWRFTVERPYQVTDATRTEWPSGDVSQSATITTARGVYHLDTETRRPITI